MGASGFERVKSKRAEIVPGFSVERLVPQRGRRKVGPWCFIDVMDSENPMSVAPHPHTGIETVTWLLEGDAVHSDSIGSVQTLLPGQLNLMTSGRGISHAEISARRSTRLLGLQFWVLLPALEMDTSPSFRHCAELPYHLEDGVVIVPIIGDFDVVSSPVSTRSASSAIELRATKQVTVELPLRPSWEYAVLPLRGSASIAGEVLLKNEMGFLPAGSDHLGLSVGSDSTVLVFGGEPYIDQYVMWWNFVAPDGSGIEEARHAWMTKERFGEVSGVALERIPAPELTFLPKPR